MRLSKTFRFLWLLTIFHSRSDSLNCLLSHVSLSDCSLFFSIFFFKHIFKISTHVVYLQCCLHVTRLVPCETAAILARSVSIIQLCTTSSRMSEPTNIRRVHACLAVTCRQHFWQNDRDILRATVVTRGWNDYWNKSQHRKFTLEKKILQLGLEPATF